MDPLTILALAQGARSLFSKKAKQPTYQPQQFDPQQQMPQYEQPEIPELGALPSAPQYAADPQEQGTGNALFQTIVGRQLANYNAGNPILDQAYRNSVLNQAKRSFDLSAGESGNQVNEQYNKLNLLGATGHGQALGEVQRSRLQGLADIEDRLTQQELQQLNNATQQGLSLQNAFAQRSNDQFRNQMATADFGRQNALSQFGAGMQRFGAGQQQYNNALGAYGANQRERQMAFQSQQGVADNQQGLGLGLLNIGAGLYGRGVGRNAGLSNQLTKYKASGSADSRNIGRYR